MARRDLTGAVDFSVLEGMTGGDAAISEEVLGLFVEQAALWSALLNPKVEGWRTGPGGAGAGAGARRPGGGAGRRGGLSPRADAAGA